MKKIIVFISILVFQFSLISTKVYSIDLQNQFSDSEFEKLYAYIDSSDLRADHIFVLDRSGSMAKFWDDVVPAITQLINNLPDGDFVSVLGFDGECKDITVPRTINDDTKKLLINEIKKLPPPKGKKTDLFNALSKTIDQINRSDGNKIKFVYFITDLVNDPPINSKFKSAFSLNKLSKQYNKVTKKLDVNLIIYALQLPLSKNAGQDYKKFLDIVHGNVERKILSGNSLAGWFKQQRSLLEYKKLRAFILTKLKSKLIIQELSSNEDYITIKIKNPYPFDIKVLNIEVNNKKNRKVSQNIEIVIPSLNSESFELKTFPELSKLKSFIRYSKVLKVNLRVEFVVLPIDEIQKLDINPLQVNQYSNENLVFATGYTLFLIIIIGVLLLTGIIYYLFPCIRPLKVFNGRKFKVSIQVDGKDMELNSDVFFPKNEPIEISHTLINLDKLTSNPPNFSINIIPFKPFFPFCLSKKRGTHIINNSDKTFKINFFNNGRQITINMPSSIHESKIPIQLRMPIKITSEFHDITGKHEINIDIALN